VSFEVDSFLDAFFVDPSARPSVLETDLIEAMLLQY
jgi:hypothetical protein